MYCHLVAKVEGSGEIGWKEIAPWAPEKGPKTLERHSI